MVDTTISVERDTLRRFRALKDELDDAQDGPDHTNETFLKALMDTWEAAEDGYYADEPACNADEIAGSVATVEERTGRIEKMLEDLQR